MIESALPFVESGFDQAPVLVLGDVMLDRHITGHVGGISPEAPVPVLRVKTERWTPGGAGNVALNLAALGCRVALIGCAGDDEARDCLVNACNHAGVDTGELVTVPGRPTTTKTRVVGGHQQILRFDMECDEALPPEIEQRLVDAATRLIGDARAVVISDYAKGTVSASTCRSVIAAARRAGVPVFVDPKGSSWAKYSGAMAITPNQVELEEAAGTRLPDESAQVAAARRLMMEHDLDFIAITRSEAGILRVGRDDHLTVPAAAQEVFDVSGAGDTVIATLAAGIAGGMEPDDALRLANLAAGDVVRHVGAVPVNRDALLATVLEQSGHLGDSKVCNLTQLRQRTALWRVRGETVVFTNGCFDLLHAGHVSYLQRAREEGDRLVLALNSDASVRRLKGPARPVMPEDERAAVLAALACVDAVVVFDSDTPLDLITALQPAVLAKGADYRLEDVVGAGEVQAWGGRVVLVPVVENCSTTGLIKKLKNADDG